MADNGEVIFLAFSNPTLRPEPSATVLACANCRNKTYLIRYEGESAFPRLRCAACGEDGGKIGFANEAE